MRFSAPRLKSCAPLTFPEHPGAGPASNAGEGALRYVVVFQKIIGQAGGGPRAMRRLADFATYTPTCGGGVEHGKSMYEEVARLI